MMIVAGDFKSRGVVLTKPITSDKTKVDSEIVCFENVKSF